MAAKTFLRLVAGQINSIKAVVQSLGASNDGDLVALDSTGKLDPSLFPTGLGPDVQVLEASENINSGGYVNIFDDGGTTKIRNADRSNAREAHGFLKTAATIGSTGDVYFEGPNDALSGLTSGARYYLGLNGAAITTAVDNTNPSANGFISQYLGIATSTTSINTDIEDYIVVES